MPLRALLLWGHDTKGPISLILSSRDTDRDRGTDLGFFFNRNVAGSVARERPEIA